jgi:hypothetical protein
MEASLAFGSLETELGDRRTYLETETRQSGTHGGAGQSAETALARANTIAASNTSFFIIWGHSPLFVSVEVSLLTRRSE